jgi:hypothetical protein
MIMRSFGALMVGGVAGIFILKLLATLLFPLFGFMVGIVGLALKVLFWAAIVYFVWRVLRGPRRSPAES